VACPPDQLLGAGCRCLCRVGGRDPGPNGCPCPAGQVKCGDGACRQCCTAAECGGLPCVGGACGCPAGQKLCDGACIPEGNCCTDADCDDGNACTIDACDPTVGCVATEVVCDSGNACLVDGCNPDFGCVHTPVGDGGACVGLDGICCDSVCQVGAECCANGDCGPCNECVDGECRAVPNLSIACDGSPLRLIGGGTIGCTTTGVCVDGACWCGAQVYDAAANRCLCGAGAAALCAALCCRVGQVCTGTGGAFGCVACP
jgi:hypothetical protein